jgi:hypothetical protein
MKNDPGMQSGDPGAGQDQATGAAPNPPGEKSKVSAVPEGMRRVRLTRSVVMNGDHAEAGEVHDVAKPLAARLIGEGSAEPHVAPGEKPGSDPTSVNRMESPTDRDPQSRRVAPAPPKVKREK